MWNGKNIFFKYLYFFSIFLAFSYSSKITLLSDKISSLRTDHLWSNITIWFVYTKSSIRLYKLIMIHINYLISSVLLISILQSRQAKVCNNYWTTCPEPEPEPESFATQAIALFKWMGWSIFGTIKSFVILKSLEILLTIVSLAGSF